MQRSHTERLRSKPGMRLAENNRVLGPSPRMRRAQEGLAQARNIDHILTTDSLRSGFSAEAPWPILGNRSAMCRRSSGPSMPAAPAC